MQEIPWKDVKRIVLLNLIANTVGDTLMVGPLITILKKHAPQAQIIVTASPQNATLLAGNHSLDKLVQIPELSEIGGKQSRTRKALRYLKLMRRTFKLLREVKPDVCFVLQPNFPPSQFIPWIARVPHRVGYKYPGCWCWALTHKTLFRGAYETKEYTRHFQEATLDILRCVNVPIQPADAVVRKWVSEEARSWARDFFKKNGMTSKDKVIAFQVGAKWASKCWPVERFAAVAKALSKHKLLLFGSAHELSSNELVAKASGGNAILVIGEDLEHVAALLEKCTLAFGNDSGLMHLASAVGTKPLVLYGMSIPEQSAPRGPAGYVAIQGKTFTDRPVLGGADTEEGIERMKTISVEQSLAAIQKALNEAQRK